jgi:hypothetical protein
MTEKTGQDVGWDEPSAMGGGAFGAGVPSAGYESDGEIAPGMTSGALSPGRVV